MLWVRDAERTATFFEEHLGFARANSFPGAVFLKTSADGPNDHDLGVFSVGADADASVAGRGPGPSKGAVGMYHLAWEVPTLAELVELRQRLQDADALVGESDHGVSKSLYCQDPDGLEFELMWAVPHELLTDDDRAVRTAPIDWDATLDRFGEATLGNDNSPARVG